MGDSTQASDNNQIKYGRINHAPGQNIKEQSINSTLVLQTPENNLN